MRGQCSVLAHQRHGLAENPVAQGQRGAGQQAVRFLNRMSAICLASGQPELPNLRRLPAIASGHAQDLGICRLVLEDTLDAELCQDVPLRAIGPIEAYSISARGMIGILGGDRGKYDESFLRLRPAGIDAPRKNPPHSDSPASLRETPEYRF